MNKKVDDGVKRCEYCANRYHVNKSFIGFMRKQGWSEGRAPRHVESDTESDASDEMQKEVLAAVEKALRTRRKSGFRDLDREARSLEKNRADVPSAAAIFEEQEKRERHITERQGRAQDGLQVPPIPDAVTGELRFDDDPATAPAPAAEV